MVIWLNIIAAYEMIEPSYKRVSLYFDMYSNNEVTDS